jgi:type II secretory ATPase GspE/PulE/Tfp pilus assembly ATPase PilB-like protein
MDSGYKGRVLLAEILYISPKIKTSIASLKMEEKKIKEISRSEGMKTLREEGEALARAGITTIEEVLRVTPAD